MVEILMVFFFCLTDLTKWNSHHFLCFCFCIGSGLVEIDFPGNEDSLRETKFRDLVWRGKELVIDDEKKAEEWGKVLIADE